MDEHGSAYSTFARLSRIVLLIVLAQTSLAESLDPAIGITLSTQLGNLSAVPATGASQSARLSLTRGGVVTDVTIDALSAVSGTLPLDGQWLEIGDEVRVDNLTDGSGVAAASALLSDTTITLLNSSATVAYDVTMSLSVTLTTNANGNDATVDASTRLTDEDSGALLIPAIGAASDSFFGPPTQNIDDSRQFSVRIPPSAQVRLLLKVDIQGAIDQLGNAGVADGYHGENQTRLSLVSARTVSAPGGNPPVDAAPVPTLSTGTWLLLLLLVVLIVHGKMWRRKGAEI